MHGTHDQGAGSGGEAKEHVSQLQLSKEVSFLAHNNCIFPLFLVVFVARGISLH